MPKAQILKVDPPYTDPETGEVKRASTRITTDGGDNGEVPERLYTKLDRVVQVAKDGVGCWFDIEWKEFGSNNWIEKMTRLGDHTTHVKPAAGQAQIPPTAPPLISVPASRKDAYVTAGLLMKCSTDLVINKVVDSTVLECARKLYFDFETLADEIEEARKMPKPKPEEGPTPATNPADAQAAAAQAAGDDIPF